MSKVKNVLITGGLGGIGINICNLFIKDHNVIIVDNLPNKSFSKKLSDHTIINNKNIILYKKIDLTKTSQIKNLFQDKISTKEKGFNGLLGKKDKEINDLK